MKYIKHFNEISLADVGSVGGKNASLGQMITDLTQYGIEVPNGFAVTSDGYWRFLEYNKLEQPLKKYVDSVSNDNLQQLEEIGKKIRDLFYKGSIPDDLAQEIIKAYHELSDYYHKKDSMVAVRSSATAEDLPGASFAGQQETFLNIEGDKQLLEAYKKCLASLFTNRAMIYRIEKGFSHFKVALSVGIQKMIRSDLATSGVMFTLDTETGFKDLVMINASYGLGELIVQGEVDPDEYRVFKTTLLKDYKPIIKKYCGNKESKLIFNEKKKQNEQVKVPEKLQKQFCLSDDEILTLARYGILIEKHYTELKKAWTPMDIEWAKDGIDNKLYIVQARPETVHSVEKSFSVTYYILDKPQMSLKILLEGQSIGKQIASGPAKVVKSIDSAQDFKEGDILVTTMTDPDWVPIMKRARAIITDHGGRTCHAAIVARELGVPALVGAYNATTVLKNGQEITVDCSQGFRGFVYDGIIAFQKKEVDVKKIPEPPVPIWINIADPSQATNCALLPKVSGVGLARIEFIIAHNIKAHPMALIEPQKVVDEKVKKQIEELTAAYPDGKTFFVDVLTQGIGTIAAAFYPKPVYVRFSDFKSNEYRNLLGGLYFEPEEENPMLGLRGASRYYSSLYAPAFALECTAIKKVREVMGLINVHIMVPMVRTVKEAEKVVKLIQEHGLKANSNFHYIMMLEVPSSVFLLDEMSNWFDGFSIGSNDLTQFILAVDRDSDLIADLFDERNKAVEELMKVGIEKAHAHKKTIGICGQAPSDYPEIAQFLIDQKIDYLSLNPDAVIDFLLKQKS